MSDIIFDNHAKQPRQQTFIIPLTFPDISLGAADIPRIGSGGDIWELRVDLLSPQNEAIGSINLPTLEYVRDQLRLLQRLSNMPILFTIRTVSQGGKFPDNAEREALELMLMAVAENTTYIDVEIEWSQDLINALHEKKGATKLVASFHDWTGDIRWTSGTLQQKYEGADTFGDVVKLSILSADTYDCHELALFLRNQQARSSKPLLAVGMGQYGQLSRVLSPISLVTHKLLPAPSAPGQLTLAEVHQAQHLIGQLPARDFSLSGPNSKSIVDMLRSGFKELGLPHQCHILQHDPKNLQMQRFGGDAANGFQACQFQSVAESVSRDAQKVGFVDTVVRTESGSTREPVFMGENISWRVIRDCVLRVDPQGSLAFSCVAVIGNDVNKARAACFAIEGMGYKVVSLLQSCLSQSLAEDFPGLTFDGQSSKYELAIVCNEDKGNIGSDALDEILGKSFDGIVLDLGSTAAPFSFTRWKTFGYDETNLVRARILFDLWIGRNVLDVIFKD
ncbi:hypothetical protein ACHAPJ_012656 [Fusarium lateritium]